MSVADRRRWSRARGSRSRSAASSSSSGSSGEGRSWTTSTATSSTDSGSGGSGLAARTRTDSQRESLHQPLADHVAEALQRPVAPLGGGEGDDVTHLRVVDGVLQPVGEHRVAVGDVEGDVDLEPLSDLPLGLADSVMGVDGEPSNLDLDRGIRSVPVRFHQPAPYRERPRLALRRSAPRPPVPRPRIASATCTAWPTSVTSWTRSTSAPARRASTLEAIVPPSRSSTPRPVSLPMKLLREVPTTIGRPSACSSPSRRRSSRLC